VRCIRRPLTVTRCQTAANQYNRLRSRSPAHSACNRLMRSAGNQSFVRRRRRRRRHSISIARSWSCVVRHIQSRQIRLLLLYGYICRCLVDCLADSRRLGYIVGRCMFLYRGVETSVGIRSLLPALQHYARSRNRSTLAADEKKAKSSLFWL